MKASRSRIGSSGGSGRESVSALDSDLGRQLLSRADPQDPLGSSNTLRRSFPKADSALIAAALTQAALVRRARERFGPGAGELLWTSDGLQQASRPAASAYRATRLLALGVRTVVDLTCGLGLDALAMAAAGLDVIAVELDPEVAEIARINARQTATKGRVTVVVGDCTDATLLTSLAGEAWFADPARRNPRAARRPDGSSRRLDRPSDWSPPWSWVRALASQVNLLVAKTAPGIDHRQLDGTASEWVSNRGDLIEVSAWWGTSAPPRSATILDDDGNVLLSVTAGDGQPDVANCGTPRDGDLLLDPDAAIVRSGLVTDFGDRVGARLVDPQLAFLTAPATGLDPVAWTGARVLHVLTAGRYDRAALASACDRHGITRVDVRGRGRRLDADRVRRDLRLPGGPGVAGTLVVMGLGEARRTVVALTVPAEPPPAGAAEVPGGGIGTEQSQPGSWLS